MSKKRKPIYHLMKFILCYVKLIAPIPIVFLIVICIDWSLREGLYLGNNEDLQVETGIVTNYRTEDAFKHGTRHLITINGHEYLLGNERKLSSRFYKYYKDNEVTLYYMEKYNIIRFRNERVSWAVYSGDQQQCFLSLEQSAKDSKEFVLVCDIIFLSSGLVLVGYCHIYTLRYLHTFTAKQEWKKFKIRLKQEKAKKNKTK